METFVRIKNILRNTLNLGERADRLNLDSPLLGGLPEFDRITVSSSYNRMYPR